MIKLWTLILMVKWMPSVEPEVGNTIFDHENPAVDEEAYFLLLRQNTMMINLRFPQITMMNLRFLLVLKVLKQKRQAMIMIDLKVQMIMMGLKDLMIMSLQLQLIVIYKTLNSTLTILNPTKLRQLRMI